MVTPIGLRENGFCQFVWTLDYDLKRLGELMCFFFNIVETFTPAREVAPFVAIFFRQVLEHLCWSQSHLEIVGLPAFALRRALAGPSDLLDSLRKMTFLLLDVSALSCGKNMELL